MTFFVNPFPQSFDANGDPTAQYTAFFGEPNQDPKLFPKAPFSDAAFQNPLATTIELNNIGGFGIDMFLDGEYSYRIENTLSGLYRSSPAIIGIPSAVLRTDEQVGGNFIVAHENLICSNPSASTIDIDATAVSVRDSSGDTLRLTSINLTVDITVVGENGLDAGSEASSTFYHYFVIFNPDTLTTSGLFSLSPTAPALPLGFTFFGLVGAVFNDSGSNFDDIIQDGNLVTLDRFDGIVLSNGTSTATSPLASIDLSAHIPVTALKALVTLDVDANLADTPSQATLFATTETTFEVADIANGGPPTASAEVHYSTSIHIRVPQTTFYRIGVGAANSQFTLTVIGWEF